MLGKWHEHTTNKIMQDTKCLDIKKVFISLTFEVLLDMMAKG